MREVILMEFSGTETIAAPIARVWAYLLDVHKVAACTPGFQSLEELGEEHWKAVISVGVGAVKAKFTLDVTRPEKHEPDLMVVPTTCAMSSPKCSSLLSGLPVSSTGMGSRSARREVEG
jgi:hypothetical protein